MSSQAAPVTVTVADVVARFNPRYVAYAKIHARDSETMLAYDKQRYPGGCMAGFMIWIRCRWAEYRKTVGLHPEASLSVADHQDFDAWLERKVSEPYASIRLST